MGKRRRRKAPAEEELPMLDTEVVGSILALLPPPLPTLRVCPRGQTLFDVFDPDNRLLGSCRSEMLAVWNAVTAAEEMSRSGMAVRVVTVGETGDVEQFVARPRLQGPPA